jgi:hypothetical protein
VVVGCRQTGNTSRSGEAETANDGKSILSTLKKDWPEQGQALQMQTGFGPLPGARQQP